MPVTLTEIAHRACCSTATVSRALNGTACVNTRTQARIVAAAAALGDRFLTPAAGAGGYRRPGRPRGSLRPADTVDVVLFRKEGVEPLVTSNEGVTVAPMTDAVPDHFFTPRYRLSTDFYRHIIEGALSVLSARGLKAVQQLRHDLLAEDFLREFNQARRRGVLLLGEPGDEVRAFVRGCRHPVVLVDILGVTGPQVVTIDNVGGVSAMVRYLVELGHRDLGFVGHAANPSYRERRLGFCGQMAESGLPVRPEWQYDGSSHIEDVARGARGLLARKRRPTALMCCNDWVAMGVERAAQDLGLRVPRDLSIAGFDDVDAAALVTPPLTTVHVPARALGAQAVRMLLDDAPAWDADVSWGCETRMRTKLVVRASTSAPGGGC